MPSSRAPASRMFEVRNLQEQGNDKRRAAAQIRKEIKFFKNQNGK
jgi:hypothetical protein